MTTHKAYIYASVIFLGLVLAIAIVVNMNAGNSGQYIAKVNGEGIPIDEFKIYMKIVKKEKERLAGVTKPEEIKKLWAGPVDGSDPVVFARQEALELVIKLKLMDQKAKELGIKITAGDESLVEEKLKAQGSYDEIKKMGIDDKQIKVIVKNTALQLKLFNQITKDVNLTQKELDDFFAQNPDLLKRYKERRYSVRHILFSTRDESKKELPQDKQMQILQLAEQVYQKAKDGEDFSKLAKEYSQDPGSKDLGGNFEFIKGEAVKEFEDTAMSLKVGEISRPVKTIFGYHIIKLDSIIEPTQQELERVKVAYKDIKVEEKRNKTFEDSINKWRQEAKLEKNEGLMNSIDINEI